MIEFRKEVLLIKKSVILELLRFSISSSFSCIIVKSVSSMLSHSKLSIRSSNASSLCRMFSELCSMGLSACSTSISMDIKVMLSVVVMVVVVCWNSLSCDSNLLIAFCALSRSV